MFIYNNKVFVVHSEGFKLPRTNSPKEATMLMYENQWTKYCKPTITVYSTIDTQMMPLPMSESFFLPCLSLHNPCKQRKINKKNWPIFLQGICLVFWGNNEITTNVKQQILMLASWTCCAPHLIKRPRISQQSGPGFSGKGLKFVKMFLADFTSGLHTRHFYDIQSNDFFSFLTHICFVPRGDFCEWSDCDFLHVILFCLYGVLLTGIYNCSSLVAPRLSSVRCLISFDSVCFVFWICSLQLFWTPCVW